MLSGKRPLGPRLYISILILALAALMPRAGGHSGQVAGQDFRVLAVDRLGPVRIGMRVDEAARALAVQFTPRSPHESEQCWVTRRADGVDPGVSYMVSDGRIRRIDVRQYRSHVPRVRTERGIVIGTPETQVIAAYRGRVLVRPHPYVAPDGHYLIVNSPDGRGGLIFETLHGRVTDFRAGIRPYLDYIEGCS